MKIEAQRDGLRLTLETRDVVTHALMTDQRERVLAALQRAADWFQAEVEALNAPPATEAVLDGRGRKIGYRVVEANPSPLVAYGRKFSALSVTSGGPGPIVYVEGQGDPLAEFRSEPER